MTIKGITRGPWGDRPHSHITWYEPMTESQEMQAAVDFVLSQPITGLCTAGDPQLLPQMLDACEHFSPMSPEAQEALIATAKEFEPLFT